MIFTKYNLDENKNTIIIFANLIYNNMQPSTNIKSKKTPIRPVENNLDLKQKTNFQKEFQKALTIEEARALSLKHVRSLWKK